MTFEKQCPTYLPNKKPAIEVVDKEGLLYRTQVMKIYLFLKRYIKSNQFEVGYKAPT